MIVLNVWNSKNTNLSETGISKARENPVFDNLTYLKIVVNSDFPNFDLTFQTCTGTQENARGDNLITPSPNTWSPQIPGQLKYLVTPNTWSLQTPGHPK